jgi:hypothetical protein
LCSENTAEALPLIKKVLQQRRRAKAHKQSTLKEMNFGLRADEGDPRTRRHISHALMMLIRGIPLHNLESHPYMNAMADVAGCGCRGANNCNSCSLPKPQKMKNIQDFIFRCICEAMRKRLAEISSVSLTADGWSDQRRNKYFAVTAHWVDDNWESQKLSLGLELLEECTGAALAASLQHFVEKFAKESAILIAAITTDNEAAMKLAAREFFGTDADRLSCFAHTLQLVVSAVLTHDSHAQPIMAVVAKLRRICSSIRNSSKAQLVRDVSALLEASQSQLLLPSPTRWDSVFMMVCRYLDCHAAVDAVLQQEGQERFTHQELSWLGALKVAFVQFEKATRATEGELYVTIASIPKWILQIEDSIARDQGDTAEISFVKSLLREHMTERCEQFCEVTDVNVALPILAAALHPKHCNYLSAFLSEEQLDVVWERVHAEALKLSLGDEDDDNENRRKRARMRRMVRIEVEGSREAIAEYCESVAEEERTLKGFWDGEGATYPHIREAAKMILGIPATSAPSERDFSRAGFVDRRAHFNCDRIELAVVVRQNAFLLGNSFSAQVDTICQLFGHYTSDDVTDD